MQKSMKSMSAKDSSASGNFTVYFFKTISMKTG